MSVAEWPSYLPLARSGELRKRAAGAAGRLKGCAGCPRACEADREAGPLGECGIGMRARVANAFPHHGEEACLSGWNGSGTIFFAGCNLGCVFCQNFEVSHHRQGEEVSPEQLARLMLKLQQTGCHNINWVSPSHIVPQALEALAMAAENGLTLPVVYNSGGYDSPETLRLLDGVVDIYMPDFKCWDPEVAGRLLHANDYPAVARQTIQEMHRQVGDLELDAEGLARRGLLIRHLVLPDGLAGTAQVARWLATRVSANTYINVMGQYQPDGEILSRYGIERFPDLTRRTTGDEVREAAQVARHCGLSRFDRKISV
jgi:putative pyruvate formate lyase activating enzyme